MLYREQSPTAALAPWIASYWEFNVDELPGGVATASHAIFPDGCVNLAYCQSATARGVLRVVGPRFDVLHVPIRRRDRFRGLRLRPGAARSLIGVSTGQLANFVGNADSVNPDYSRKLSELFCDLETVDDPWPEVDRWLTHDAQALPQPNPTIIRAVNLICDLSGRIEIGDLCEQLEISRRQIERLFKEEVGLTPKQFARIRRFRDSLGEVLGRPNATWSEIANDLGYADQAHLVREYRNFAGLPPSAVGDYVRKIEHKDVLP